MSEFQKRLAHSFITNYYTAANAREDLRVYYRADAVIEHGVETEQPVKSTPTNYSANAPFYGAQIHVSDLSIVPTKNAFLAVVIGEYKHVDQKSQKFINSLVLEIEEQGENFIITGDVCKTLVETDESRTTRKAKSTPAAEPAATPAVTPAAEPVATPVAPSAPSTAPNTAPGSALASKSASNSTSSASISALPTASATPAPATPKAATPAAEPEKKTDKPKFNARTIKQASFVPTSMFTTPNVPYPMAPPLNGMAAMMAQPPYTPFQSSMGIPQSMHGFYGPPSPMAQYYGRPPVDRHTDHKPAATFLIQLSSEYIQEKDVVAQLEPYGEVVNLNFEPTKKEAHVEINLVKGVKQLLSRKLHIPDSGEFFEVKLFKRDSEN